MTGDIPIFSTPAFPLNTQFFWPNQNLLRKVLALTKLVSLYLSAAYGTIWWKGLLAKLYNLIPYPILFRFFNSTLIKRLNYKFNLGHKFSSFRIFNNGCPPPLETYCRHLTNKVDSLFPTNDLFLKTRIRSSVFL